MNDDDDHNNFNGKHDDKISSLLNTKIMKRCLISGIFLIISTWIAVFFFVVFKIKYVFAVMVMIETISILCTFDIDITICLPSWDNLKILILNETNINDLTPTLNDDNSGNQISMIYIKRNNVSEEHDEYLSNLMNAYNATPKRKKLINQQ